MASYYLIKSILLGTTQRWAGELISDPSDLTELQSIGAALWVATDSHVAAAAVEAQRVRLRGGFPEDCTDIMVGAVEAGSVQPAIPLHDTWTQADWYVDPVNGNDTNPGTISLPVKTIMGGVVGKWGTSSPNLAQSTTIHLVKPQPVAAEEIFLYPRMTSLNSIFRITGTLQLNRSIVLGVVTAKNRANKQVLQAAGFTGATVGQIVVNTTVGKSSRAQIIAIAGGVATLSQPLTTLTPGVDTTYLPVPTEVDTWAQNDTVTIYDAPAINLVDIEVRGGLDNAAYTTSALWIDQLHVVDPSGTPGSTVFYPRYIGGEVIIDTIWCDAYLQTSRNNFTTSLVNSYVTNGGQYEKTQVIGGASDGFGIQADELNWVDGDHVILPASNIWATGLIYLGYVAVLGQLGLHPSTAAELRALNYVSGFLYGPGSLSLQASTTLVRRATTTSWANSLSITTMTLPSSANTGTAFNPATNVWTSGVALTTANLDTNHGLQDPRAGARFAEDL